MNREDRRRLSRANKGWLARVAANPAFDVDTMLVAAWLAENADDDGVIQDPAINRLIHEATR